MATMYREACRYRPVLQFCKRYTGTSDRARAHTHNLDENVAKYPKLDLVQAPSNPVRC